MREQAPRAFGTAPQSGASCCRFSRMREQAPRFLADARRCPPSLVGFLARIWAARFASGDLMNLTANLEAPWRKTPTFKKPPVSPHSGGQRRRRGGHVTPSARPTTRHPASQKPRTQRQVCPPPERSETQGGRGRAIARAAGGAPKLLDVYLGICLNVSQWLDFLDRDEVMT